MAYTKIIRSGDQVESWTYERAPNNDPQRIRRKRGRRISHGVRRLDNVRKSRDSFRRLVRANLTSDNPPALCTLTFRGVVDISEGYRAYSLFVQRFRRLFGTSLVVIGVPEFQKRGSVHFHLLVFGLSDEAIRTERSTRKIAKLWGEGFVDVVPTDGNARLSSYLAKYMSKAMQDTRLSGKRAYSATRNVLRPVSLNRPHEVIWADREWGLSTDARLLKSREYDTLFLGRCVYTNLIISP